jgi:hypothetical protein
MARKTSIMEIRRMLLVGLTSVPALVAACGGEEPAPQMPTPQPSDTAIATPPVVNAPTRNMFDRLTRSEFNRLAPELAVPLFWKKTDKDNIIDPSELTVYWGLEKEAKISDYVWDGQFTQKMRTAYDAMVNQKMSPPLDPRQAAVRKELAQGKVTLLASDFSKASDAEKKFVAAIMKASVKIEALYLKQEGTFDYGNKIPTTDPASRSVFFRNQEPMCRAPETEHDTYCGALKLDDMPKGKISGMYPADQLAKNDHFCEDLAKSKDKSLIDPFTSVVANDRPGQPGALTSKSFHETWPDDVKAISADLKEASAALGTTEPALRAYVDAAAKAFTDDSWFAADEAWVKMDTKNSKFFLRIGPDEVYREPCSTKALYKTTLGRVNQGAAQWQAKFDPLKNEMEGVVAKLAGAPYAQRRVAFKLPDFIDIVLNAGDERLPSGATAGQSLPNFGPVANQGRGRTVAMTNLYSDADSIESARAQAESLFCKDTMAKWSDDPSERLMSTVLHEAAHNLGPSHQYKVNGKIDRESFGGPLASTLEELKASTAALYFTDWLVSKGQLDRNAADRSVMRDVFWAFDKVAQGMYEDNKHPKNYSQLAAIQVGWLMKNGAIVWKADEKATNGKDSGCYSIDLARVAPAVTSLMTEVAQIKAKGDKARADQLLKDWVDVSGDKKRVHEIITERMTRAPKQTFVYSVKLD